MSYTYICPVCLARQGAPLSSAIYDLSYLLVAFCFS